MFQAVVVLGGGDVMYLYWDPTCLWGLGLSSVSSAVLDSDGFYFMQCFCALCPVIRVPPSLPIFSGFYQSFT